MGRLGTSALLTLAFVLGAPAAGVEVRATQDAGLELQGRVVEDVWANALAGVEVVLMAGDYRELGRTVTDGQGGFRLPLPGPGTYVIQARSGNFSSAPAGPLDVAAGEDPDEVVLALPSAPALAVLRCFEEEGGAATAVVLGVAHEAVSGIPLPGAEIAIDWSGEEGVDTGSARVLSGEDGRFHLCGLPAGVAMTVRTRILGRTNVPLDGLVLQPGSVVRADLPMEVDARERGGPIALDRVGTAEPGVLSGTLVDATTEAAVAGALVRMPGSGRERETDARGRFLFDGVGPGVHALEVEHLGYGLQRAEVELAGPDGLTVAIRVEPRALLLEGIEVTARRGTAETAPVRPFSRRGLRGERLATLDRQGVSMMAAVRQISAGLTIRGEGRAMCVESRRAATGMRGGGAGCRMVAVVLDGVPVLDPRSTLASLSVSELESMEYLSPLEAGFRYGMEASASGALVVWTRGRGPYRSPARDGGGS